MSLFCNKYPQCGCIGIGTKCYSKEESLRILDKAFPDNERKILPGTPEYQAAKDDMFEAREKAFNTLNPKRRGRTNLIQKKKKRKS